MYTINMKHLTTSPVATYMYIHVPYSRKIWQGIKVGGLAVYATTAKLKSAKISYLHTCVYTLGIGYY